MGEDNPFKNLKKGAFTRQASHHGFKDLDKFAKYVIKHYKDKNSSYNPTLTTFRRAQFYLNLIKKKKKIKKHSLKR